MAQTKRKRRRKHRGTQTGRVDRRRGPRPRNRSEARARYRSQQSQRHDSPPSWRSAFNRGLVAAGLFFALMLLLFRRPLAQSIAISVLMLAFYVPLGYYTDLFFYKRRQSQRERERERRRQERAGG